MNKRLAAALSAVLFWSTNALAAKFGLADLTVWELLTIQFFAATITLMAYIPRISDAISRQFPRPSLSPSAGSRFLGGGKVFLR